ncbi:hypothetical protein [Streptomyces jumonjinensis]|uniref:Uncharacterized protein n=1 Tax=Streptomyces jumonjinensis TaxID=1945 RepID=A0A646KJX5_STRJU|nr:hypothetical protein [Streptomyces jumonjinensis]MQT02579.1 hypothetical protein [Streptomyces jumonjinensis]
MINSSRQEGAESQTVTAPGEHVLPIRERTLTDGELVARQYVRWENRAATWSVPWAVEGPDGPVTVVLPPGTPRGPFPRANRATLARLYMGLADYRARMGAT